MIDEPNETPDPQDSGPATRDEEPTETDDDLDLDLEESDDGDRLKEGFTGQER